MASFIRSSAFSTIAGIISMVFGFVGSIIVARLLGADGTGEVAFGLWVAMTVPMLANFGIPAILLRYMQRYDSDVSPGGGLARRVLVPFAVPLALSAIALVIYALWIKDHAGSSQHSAALWIMTAFLLLSYGGAAFGEAAARGLNRFDETARLAFYGCLLQLPLIAIGGYFFGPAGALAGHVARHLPQALRSLHYVMVPVSGDARLTRDMKIFSRTIWFSNAVGMLVWSRAEFFFLGLYLTTTEIGYYAAGLTLASLMIQLPTQMLGALGPHLSRAHDDGDELRITRTYQRVMRWLCLILLPACLGGAVIMTELLPFLFGKEFSTAVPTAAVLVGTAFVTSFSIVPSALISVRERSDFWLYASPISAIVSLGAFAIVTPLAGEYGTAWARALVHTFWFIWLTWFCWVKLKTRLDLLDLARVALSAVACAAAAFAVLNWFSGVAAIAAAMVAGAIVYMIALRLSKAIPREDVDAFTHNLPEAIPGRLRGLVTFVLGQLAAPEMAKDR